MLLTLEGGAGAVSITVLDPAADDGVVAELVMLPEVTVAMARDLREQAGLTAPMLGAAIAAGVGPEELAAMVFLARRQADKAASRPVTATYAAAVADVDDWTERSLTVEIDFDAAPPAPEDGSPEA